MLFLEALVERQIQEAQQQGMFDDLPGSGKPLILEDDSQVPENLRMSYRILKMSGFLPEALQLRQDALSLKTLLAQATDADKRSTYHAQLELIKSRLSHASLSAEFLYDIHYGEEVKRKIIGKG
ncbi:DUF1992 domain-containing protein [Rosenbergiella sp. S61]|uniref:DUF1992 domain-containing protein n=1 Tax=Rosenbergiella gaditana TaxID=2726987 RepID=A0ABS5SZZ1_9GAMM|nr:DnaJ family domain-containing protein [Rosenbergiella gaditana]MBT0725631.1 DUF1992 domain-containing protein [Rosenbergiella gaditana]